MIIHNSPYPDIRIPQVSLPTFIFRPLEQFPNDERLQQPLCIPAPHHDEFNPQPQRPATKDVRGLSLAQLKTRSEHFALGLRANYGWGASAGSSSTSSNILSIVSENQHDYTAAVLGAHLVGAQVALHNPSYTATELAHQFRLVRSSAVLCSNKACKKCSEACRRAHEEGGEGLDRLQGDQPPSVWVFDEEVPKDDNQDASDVHSWFDLITRGEREAAEDATAVEQLWAWHREHVTPSEDAAYCFSSGTSGKPKAVRLTHGNLVANVIQATSLMNDRTMPPLLDRWAESGAEQPQPTEQSLSASSWYNPPRARHPELVVDGDGVQHTRQATALGDEKTLLSFAKSLASKLSFSSSARQLAKPQQEVHIDILPQFHCYGLVVALVAMHTATPRYVLPRFSLPLFLHLVEKHSVTFAFVVPPILLALSRSDVVVERFGDLSSLTRLASGAASLPGGLRREVWEKRHIVVTDGFGQTEMSPIICLQTVQDLQDDKDEAAMDSVGQLAANTQARVVDVDTGEDLPSGRENRGELWLRGPQMMAGYLRNDEANQSAFFVEEAERSSGQRWLRTGDVVSIDARGYVKIHDRTKDVIKVKGFQVSPAELEDIILANPLVHDVAVVGIRAEEGDADSDGSDKPWAYCVGSERGKKEIEDEGQRAQRVKEEVNGSGKIARYKHIAGVTWMDALPKSEAGKVLKKELQKRAGGAR
ncbi:unnamed protein product [Jaminaea pallidilutea]